MQTFAAVTLCGYVGRDTELRATRGGTPVRSISIATGGRGDKETVWWSMALFGSRAESLAPLKGDLVFVTGQVTHVYQGNSGSVSVEGRIDAISWMPKQVGGQDAPPEMSEPGGDEIGEEIPF